MEVMDTAVKAAKRAGALLKDNLDTKVEVEYKGEVDLVTEMDKRAEDGIIDDIKAAFPDHGILTEESAERKSDSRYRWIIDPLDGTTNYAHGFPIFCVSIALEDDGEVVLGVVFVPVLGELFTAEKGKGAFINGKPIKVSSTRELDKSLLATGFPYDIRNTEKNNLDNFRNFSLKAQAIRRAGSAAIDLSYVACGRFDGFWEMKLNPWDVAAASLIVSEAGGRLTDFSGGEFSIFGSECLATNGLVHGQMLETLAAG